jgi:hypothetical protein
MRCGKDACAGGVVFGCDLELEHRVDYTILGPGDCISYMGKPLYPQVMADSITGGRCQRKIGHIASFFPWVCVSLRHDTFMIPAGSPTQPGAEVF